MSQFRVVHLAFGRGLRAAAGCASVEIGPRFGELGVRAQTASMRRAVSSGARG